MTVDQEQWVEVKRAYVNLKTDKNGFSTWFNRFIPSRLV
ncbi:hypothetical protein MGSAQ_000227 [marine sediment metagenome]|uniref:Uncharacterized protein n=1 Tax=marine sediment metagenome TaxID=412755 RepID=A0A1B6NXY5_9ZZZZ